MASEEMNTGSAEAGNSGHQTGRSIVVDTTFFEEQFLRCQVCHERFNQSERSPKSLPCNHTFCLPCLSQIFDHAQTPSRRNLIWADATLDGALKCPTCRVEIYLSKNKIKDLPSDHRVVQLMDFLSQAVSTSQNVCTKHELQPLNFFCKHCLIPVCRDCTVLDHKEQQGHIIVDVKQALSDTSGEFVQVEEKCRQSLEKMKTRSDALAHASKRLDIQERQLSNLIKETFIEYRLLLEKRQEALIHKLQQTIRNQKAVINTRFVSVCENGTQLQKLFDSFSEAKTSNNVQQLFTLHKKLKDQEKQFNTIATLVDEDLFKSCTFESTAEGEFLSEISSLGEVSTKDDLGLKEPITAHQLVYLDMEERRERERQNQYSGCDPMTFLLAEQDGSEDQDLDELTTADMHRFRYSRYSMPADEESIEDESIQSHLFSDTPLRSSHHLLATLMPEVSNMRIPNIPVSTLSLDQTTDREMANSNREGDSSARRAHARSQRTAHQYPRYPQVVRHQQNMQLGS